MMDGNVGCWRITPFTSFEALRLPHCVSTPFEKRFHARLIFHNWISNAFTLTEQHTSESIDLVAQIFETMTPYMEKKCSNHSCHTRKISGCDPYSWGFGTVTRTLIYTYNVWCCEWCKWLVYLYLFLPRSVCHSLSQTLCALWWMTLSHRLQRSVYSLGLRQPQWINGWWECSDRASGSIHQPRRRCWERNTRPVFVLQTVNVCASLCILVSVSTCLCDGVVAAQQQFTSVFLWLYYRLWLCWHRQIKSAHFS